MRLRLWYFPLLVTLFGYSACTVAMPKDVAVEKTSIPATPTSRIATLPSCSPTFDDGVSPSYRPNAPERTVVGEGHVVSGVVFSSSNCQPIANAKLEFWPEEAGLGHPDMEARKGHLILCSCPNHREATSASWRVAILPLPMFV